MRPSAAFASLPLLVLLAGCAAQPPVTLEAGGYHIIGALQRGSLMVDCPGHQDTLHAIGVFVANHASSVLVLGSKSWSVTWADGSVRHPEYVEEGRGGRPAEGVAPGSALNLTVFACAPNPLSGHAAQVALLDGPGLDAAPVATLRLLPTAEPPTRPPPSAEPPK